VENIIQSGADVVVSPDISCLMHVGGMLERNAETKHIEVKHIAEVLDAGIQ
jgi:Fe-S oxidoreductase